MPQPLTIQLAFPATPAELFRAWTDANRLAAWFAEFATVSRAEKRYDFWDRFTPEAPNQDQGHHPPVATVFDILIRPDQLERWIASQATVEPRMDAGRIGWQNLADIGPQWFCARYPDPGPQVWLAQLYVTSNS